MRILLTGGAGDLGYVLSKQLDHLNETALRFDVRPPTKKAGTYAPGSILDRTALASVMTNVDCVVHIAAWHGIHEFRKQKDAYDFWDVNVTGTFNVFEAAARAQIARMIFISSTSVEERDGLYGHTKVLGEEIARTYAARHGMSVITLRPRAFIPYWNRDAYNSFVEWAHWFWGGAVHINDVAQAVMNSIRLLTERGLENNLVLTVDGAYEYSEADLQNWDADGAGSTFLKYYTPYHDLAIKHGLNPEQKPTVYDMTETRHWLNYKPGYSLMNLLQELETYGEQGPPSP
ncbi:MAG: NAD(P)-dependent oxidoreductase [Anaerolineae bacterium]